MTDRRLRGRRQVYPQMILSVVWTMTMLSINSNPSAAAAAGTLLTVFSAIASCEAAIPFAFRSFLAMMLHMMMFIMTKAAAAAAITSNSSLVIGSLLFAVTALRGTMQR